MTTRPWFNNASGRADAQILCSLPAPFAVVLGETFPRATTPMVNIAPLASGRMQLAVLPLQAGVAVSSLTFVSGDQAMVTPSNWWFALYTGVANPGITAVGATFLRQSADQTTTAWPANTFVTLNLSSSYTPTYTGQHIVTVCCVAATVPSLTGMAQPAHVTGLFPGVTGYSGTGLTGTAPSASALSITTTANIPYAYAA